MGHTVERLTRRRGRSGSGRDPRGRAQPSDRELIDTCRERSIALLKRNLSPEGILAATPGPLAVSRGYTSVFGRDAAICAIGMALSGDERLERQAAKGLHTLAAHQAPNGQIPKFVDVHRKEADFWYLGCIDSTLWWLIGVAFLDACGEAGRGARDPGPRVRTRSGAPALLAAGSAVLRKRLGATGESGGSRSSAQLRAVRPGSSVNRERSPRPRLRAEYAGKIELALRWLLAQEHQRFFLLQQNEASDWADIMPRSGFVLYTNALWYFVKRLYALARTAETRSNFNGMFHPFSAALAEYRRARLLNDYVLRRARSRDLYLSFVNFSFFGEEGDVFGNVLAALLGVADVTARNRTLDALQRARIGEPYPARAVMQPITRRSLLWRPYMERHRQNHAWQYHNGGIWPMVGAFWVSALVAGSRHAQARQALVRLARACSLENWAFSEWLHGRTLAPRGMPGQSWNAAGFLMADFAVRKNFSPLDL